MNTKLLCLLTLSKCIAVLYKLAYELRLEISVTSLHYNLMLLFFNLCVFCKMNGIA